MAKKKADKKPVEKVFVTRQQVIEADDIKTEDVPVPEWAPEGADPATCFVHVVGMDGNRRDAYQNMLENARKKNTIDLTGLTTKLVIAVVLDPETGQQVFNDHDLAILQSKSSKPMERIQQVGQRLSGIGQENLKEVMENLGLAPKEDSGSDSQKK